MTEIAVKIRLTYKTSRDDSCPIDGYNLIIIKCHARLADKIPEPTFKTVSIILPNLDCVVIIY